MYKLITSNKLIRCNLRVAGNPFLRWSRRLSSAEKRPTEVDGTNGEVIGEDSEATVIIGGGIVGVSIAYHLAKQGEKGVVVLEKTELTAGSTWHAAGLVTNYHPITNLKKIHYYSLNFYSKIAAETGQEVGFHQPGSIRIATKPETVDEFRFQMAKAGGSQQAPQCLITPEEIKEKVPLIDKDKVFMGLFTPCDGHIDPYSVTQAIAKGARRYGVGIRQGVEVTSLDLKDDGRWRIETNQGEIGAKRVVNAAGFWARDVGKLAGLDLPLVPIQHQYLVTSSVPEIQALKTEFPVLRLLEASCYIRQERDGFLIGVYETQESMNLNESWSKEGVPKGFGKELFPPDLDRMMPHLEQLMDVIPSFANANIQSVVNGPITYTPDLLPLVGPSTLPNMWLAVGFGYGIVHGGGIGKFLADWIQNGEPTFDLMACDPGRFGAWVTNEYLFAKARECYGMNNALTYPQEERFAGRPTSRVTSAYERQIERGASMVIDAGWEHPGWFAGPGDKPEYKPSFRRTNHHLAVKREWKTVKEFAGIIDLSAFAKFILRGTKAKEFLDYISANRVPSLGRSVVTHLLTPSAKVLAEVTVTQVEEGRFLIVTGGGSELHDLRWMEAVAREEAWDVTFENLSDDLGVLSVAGPNSKEILSNLHPRFKEKFPFFTSSKLRLCGIEVTAIRLTYTGEIGWEIYHKKEDTGSLYDLILEAGQELGLDDFGALTLNVLRLEKGFRLWGRDMNHDKNIVQAGLLPFVSLSKKDFIGKGAVERILREVPSSELIMVKIDPRADCDPQGDETIWLNDQAIGNITSGAFSWHLNQPLAFAYLPPLFTTPGTIVQVEMMTQKYDAEVLRGPPDLTYNQKILLRRK